MSEEIPRDPEAYRPTTHAGQQAKHRRIGWEYVAETIREGEIKPSHKENCVVFVREFISKDKPVGVVANYADGAVITVEYRD